MAHIHILGICGTFMGGIAALAQAMGHKVTGSDRNIYPPMSTMLANLGIDVFADDDVTQLHPAPDLVIIGNALSRGHPLVEAVLQQRIPYTSGPQWLGEQVLRKKHVLAVSGTHGKTTTAAMLVWILEQAGLQPSFLVGGVVQPFGITAHLSASDLFVIEADEYDTAFFDKRSKFLHYFANTLVINNLEFDHADIFSDLAAIQQQFANVLRTVPSDGQVIYPCQPAIEAVIAKGCWSQRITTASAGSKAANAQWHHQLLTADGSAFAIFHQHQEVARVAWNLLGAHNADNGLMAVIAATQVGVPVAQAAAALASFNAPARRLECKGEAGQVRVYDDFAHHPTAIATTIQALRAKVGPQQRLLAIFEPRSNTMKAGVHQATLAAAFKGADAVYVLVPEQVSWSLADTFTNASMPVFFANSVADLVALIIQHHQDRQQQAVAQPEHWLVMSNGAFGGIHQKLLQGASSF